jgi:hypothetical protein
MTTDPRVTGIVKGFKERYHLEGTPDTNFQLFANCLVFKKVYFEVNKVYPYESEINIDFLQDLNLDTPEVRSMAVDGCFVLNGTSILHLNKDDTDVDAYMSAIGGDYLDVVLIQSKSTRPDYAILDTLAACLNVSFSGQEKWNRFVAFKSKCNNLLQANPNMKIRFRLIYVIGSKIEEDFFSTPEFSAREKNLKTAMKEYFWISDNSDVQISFIYESNIYKEYEQQQSVAKHVSETIQYFKITDEIDCGGQGKVKIAVISLKEIMKILFNKKADRPNELYDYNVRDALKNSKINETIKNSLQTNKDLFLLLNNGLTIIVDKQELRGEHGILLENIKIINGCQTSHAILDVCKMSADYDDVKICVKIIQTNRDDIAGQITFSSNNQNSVGKANMFAIEPKIFSLEKQYQEFFLGYKKNLKMVSLERRQGQYNNQDNSYIDMLAQAKAYISLWEKSPHDAAMYADTILDTYKLRIDDNDFIEKSVFSGILWFNVLQSIPSQYHIGRFHILTCVAMDVLRELYSISKFDKDFINSLGGLLNKLAGNEMDIKEKVKFACAAIDNIPAILPKNKNSGRIHYRKFYQSNVLAELWKAYNDLRK